MRERLKSFGWLLLLLAVVCAVFYETIFLGFSLVTTDLLHNLLLPYTTTVSHVSVKNHYLVDAVSVGYPWSVFWQETVRLGQLPLWNPYILGGLPQLAESGAGILNPLRLLLLILPAERAFSLGVVAEYFLGAVFMFAFLRELGRSGCAALVGSCAFVLGDNFVSFHWMTPGLFAWAPLVLLLFERSRRRDSWGYACAAGVALAVGFVGGNIQIAAHLGLLCAGYFAADVIWGDRQQRGRAAGRGILVLLVALLVSAPQWLPTLELMMQDAFASTAVRGTHASLRHTLVGLPMMVTFVFPGLTGSNETFDLLKLASASRGDFAAYIGIVPFALALVGAFGTRDWRVRGLVAIIIAVVVIIFFTPLLKFMYHRFFVVAATAGSVIAAYGTDILLDSSETQVRRIRRVLFWMTVCCVLVALGVLGVQIVISLKHDALVAAARHYVAKTAGQYAFGFRADWFQERVTAFFEHYRISNVVFWLPLTCFFGLAGAWAAHRRRWINRAAMAAVLVAATATDLAVMSRQSIAQIDLRRYPLQPFHPTLEPVLADRDLFRVHRWGTNSNYIYRPNWFHTYGIYDLCGTFSLAPECLFSLPEPADGRFGRLLDLQNVKYIFVTQNVTLAPDHFALLVEKDGVRLYRNKQCLPRFQFIPQWEVIPDRKKLLARLTSLEFDPQRVVLLEQSLLPQSATSSPTQSDAVIEVQRYTPLSVVAKVRTQQAGLLLLSDTYYTGWKARLDGQSASLYRADYVMRAVWVPEGEHLVEFRYVPRMFWIGTGLSLGTLVSLTLLGIWRLTARNRWRRKPSTSNPPAADSASTIR